MSTPGIAVGSRWRLKRGQHAGSLVQIQRANNETIKYRNLGGGKSVGSTPFDDEGRLHTRNKEEFLTLFEPATSGGDGATHTAWRRTYQPKLVEEEMPEATAAQAPSKNGTTPEAVILPKPDQFGLTYGIELITPEMARNWLDKGGANRKISGRGLQKLITAIQIGEWKVTGESIQLDDEGRVRNGQHRLEAIYRSGTPCYALVVRGVQEDAFDVIDTGTPRSAANVLEIHGHTQTIAKSTAARGLIHIERYGRYAPGTVRSTVPGPSNAAILAYVEAHPEIADGVHMGDRLRVHGKFVGGSGLWAIAFALFIRISPEQAEVFCSSLIEGANLESGSPVLKLRNMYIGGGRDWQATSENRERLLALAIKAWNFWRRDELVQMLTWHNSGRAAERFPMPE